MRRTKPFHMMSFYICMSIIVFWWNPINPSEKVILVIFHSPGTHFQWVIIISEEVVKQFTKWTSCNSQNCLSILWITCRYHCKEANKDHNLASPLLEITAKDCKVDGGETSFKDCQARIQTRMTIAQEDGTGVATKGRQLQEIGPCCFGNVRNIRHQQGRFCRKILTQHHSQ